MKNSNQNNLPAAIDIEEYLLGSLLLENSAIDEVSEILNNDCFYDEKNRLLYQLIMEKYDEGISVDSITVYNELKKRNLSEQITPVYISQLTGGISSAANSTNHAKILFEKWILRELIKRANLIMKQAQLQSEDPFVLINKAADTFSDIMNEINKLQPNLTLWDSFYEFLDKIEQRASGKQPEGLLSQAFPSFNRMTGSMQEGDLITIYGLPKHGKTTLALQLCLDVAFNLRLPVAMFSLEMSRESIFNKAASMRADIDYRKLRSPKVFKLTSEEFKPFMDRAKKQFEETKFFVFDQITDKLKIKAKMKELKSKFGIKLFAVDYIGLIHTSTKREQRNLEIADLSRYFKLLAKELQTPILILSQANENGDTFESKALLQDSDFAFISQKPTDIGMPSINKRDGSKFVFTEDHFLVTLKKSRHTINQSQFVCHFHNNNFVETNINSII